MIERRESGRPVGLLSTTGISKNCAPRKKAAATSYLLCNCIVRDLYFSNATSSFSYLSLSLRRHTICFPRDFLVKTENSSECGRGKSRRESFPRFLVRFFTAFSFPTSRNSAPRMEMARCFGASLGINERHARRIARIYKSLNKSVSKYLYHTFLSQVLSRKLALPDTLARPSIQKLVVLVEVIISYVVIWRNLKRI